MRKKLRPFERLFGGLLLVAWLITVGNWYLGLGWLGDYGGHGVALICIAMLGYLRFVVIAKLGDTNQR